MKLVAGVGINDASYPVKPRGGEHCKIHRLWSNMINRCYSESYLLRFPSYRGCFVVDSWLRFSNFREWVILQDWNGEDHLDKDLIYSGNKWYGPDRCIFVSRKVNNFINTNKSNKTSGLPLGVGKTASGGYIGQTANINGDRIYSKVFTDPEHANLWYTETKTALALELANQQANTMIRDLLIEKYT